jgi:divalent metal cation (Fe/Co/Zn/Cd) transporter
MAMNEQPKARRIASNILAIALWLVSFVLGLQAIYALAHIIALIQVMLGGGFKDAELAFPGLVFILALAFLIFIVASTEYHLKRAGKPQSWRLFTWTIAAEVSLLILYYFLL